MSKVPSYSSLGITGPLITDAIGLSQSKSYQMQMFGHSAQTDRYTYPHSNMDRTHGVFRLENIKVLFLFL